MNYKYLSDTIVAKIDDDGLSRMSCSIEHPEYLAWLAEGNTPEPADPPDPNTLILEQIQALEQQVTPRRLRDAYSDPTWIINLEHQISTLRSQLQ